MSDDWGSLTAPETAKAESVSAQSGPEALRSLRDVEIAEYAAAWERLGELIRETIGK